MGTVSALRIGQPNESEQWRTIEGFEDYKISDEGRVRAVRNDKILILSQNQDNVVNVGLMRHGVQHHRSVALLVAKAFIPNSYPAFDTPIHLNGDRWDNRVCNLLWRPRWFAVRYNRQWRWPYMNSIALPLEDMKSGQVYENSWEAAIANGLLEEDLIESIANHTYVWPTYQQFRISGL